MSIKMSNDRRNIGYLWTPAEMLGHFLTAIAALNVAMLVRSLVHQFDIKSHLIVLV